MQIFKHGLKSYRDLPVKLAEFGSVHRYEPSGALHGLMRVRGFTQDDAHIFCTEEQLAAECLKINDLILTTYADFGFDEITVKLATRPEKRVGTDAMWDHAEDVLSRILQQIAAQSGNRIKTGINPGEGTFYGPKFEYVLRDAIGREWQCGTTQVDFNLPERFGAFYIGADSEKKRPVMVHRAICGSMERFLGILIENYSGHFPLWFAPVQVVVATITSDADDYAMKVAQRLRSAGLAVETRPAQREDQLQGSRALADQGSGDPRLRQARGRGSDGQHAPARVARPGSSAPRCRGRAARSWKRPRRTWRRNMAESGCLESALRAGKAAFPPVLFKSLLQSARHVSAMLNSMRRKEILFPELSYANADHTRLKRWFIRSVEGLSGRDRYARLYEIWRRDIAPTGDRIFGRMLDLIDVSVRCRTNGRRRTCPTAPLVIIANHPFGIGDGIAVLSMAEQLGRPFRVMINAELLKIEEMKRYSLPIDFQETKEALKNNLAVRQEALQLLKQGVTIVIFPGGGVATAPHGFGKAQDLPWKMFPARLVQEAKASVIPVAFLRPERPAVPHRQRADEHGRRGQQAEAHGRPGVAHLADLAADPRIHAAVGQVDQRADRQGRPWSELEPLRDRKQLIAHLYRAVFSLAPAATGSAGGATRRRLIARRRRSGQLKSEAVSVGFVGLRRPPRPRWR